MDLGTWRLVGFGILGLGSLATVIAVVAIIAMFRAARTDDDDVHGDAEWDDDAGADANDEEDVEDQDDVDVRRDSVTAALAMQATGRQEPHVVSPDWYGSSNATAEEPGTFDVGHDAASEAVDAAPIAPYVRPPAPVRQEPQRPAVAWADEPAQSDPVEAAPVAPEHQPDTRHGGPAREPMAAPAEQTPATGRRRRAFDPADEPADSDVVEAAPVAPTRPSRHGGPGGEPMTAPAAAIPEPTPATGRRRRAADPDDEPAAQESPDAAARDEPDSPIADWYDDPDGSGGERWWDGRGWTRHRRQRSQPNRLTGGQLTSQSGPVIRPRAASEPQQTAGAQRSHPPSRPAGWYRDPSDAGRRRFWNGSEWDTES